MHKSLYTQREMFCRVTRSHVNASENVRLIYVYALLNVRSVWCFGERDLSDVLKRKSGAILRLSFSVGSIGNDNTRARRNIFVFPFIVTPFTKINK